MVAAASRASCMSARRTSACSTVFSLRRAQPSSASCSFTCSQGAAWRGVKEVHTLLASSEAITAVTGLTGTVHRHTEVPQELHDWAVVGHGNSCRKPRRL